MSELLENAQYNAALFAKTKSLHGNKAVAKEIGKSIGMALDIENAAVVARKEKDFKGNVSEISKFLENVERKKAVRFIFGR